MERKLTDIETVLRQLKIRKELLIKLIGKDAVDDMRYQEGKLQAITEVIGLIEGSALESEG